MRGREDVGVVRRRAARVGAGALSLATSLSGLLVAVAAPSHAGEIPGAEVTPDGYAASVSVTYTGDTNAARASTKARVPATCWWEKVADDPEEFEKWFDQTRSGHGPSSAAGGREFTEGIESYPDSLEDAKKLEKSGTDIAWYKLNYRAYKDPSTGYSDHDKDVATLTQLGCTDIKTLNYAGGADYPLPISFRAYPVGTAPEPRIDPESLADAAYEVMDIQEPVLEWNPRIGASGGAALLNLPTWMWVDDSNAVRDLAVRAEAAGVTSTVTASTGGISISSPNGSRRCSPDAAQVRYGKGVPESSACTWTFSEASYLYPNGFPVAARTDWTAQWTSNLGVGGDLPGRNVSRTTLIPVAGSQALVTDIG